MKKLNLGSGPNCLPDWENIDNSFNAKLSTHPILKELLYKIKILPKEYYDIKWPSNMITSDIRFSLPFENNTVDFIYTSHTLEHMEHYEATEVLRNCYRILKKDAIIRIILPDLERMILKYNRDRDINDFLNRFYGYERSKETKKDNLLLKHFKHQPHQWMYDFKTLKSKLQKVGFQDIKELKYQKGKCPDIEKLDSKEGTNMYVEARK